MLLIGFAVLQFLTFMAVMGAPVRHSIGPRAQYVKMWGLSVSGAGALAFLVGLATFGTGFELLLWISLFFFWMGTLFLIFSKWWAIAR
ncbi:hypothetical protein GCM10009760_52740 [Kitasatospora kazusensis]|uniref:Uncharacterized protein n=1 Tax=Kitasatospora kazusensis TaxID=407974 RepID=A0ABN3A622_9ACTN